MMQLLFVPDSKVNSDPISSILAESGCKINVSIQFSFKQFESESRSMNYCRTGMWRPKWSTIMTQQPIHRKCSALSATDVGKAAKKHHVMNQTRRAIYCRYFSPKAKRQFEIHILVQCQFDDQSRLVELLLPSPRKLTRQSNRKRYFDENPIPR